jgi:hypothetical protein
LSQGRTAGLQLHNAGLGPAVITRTVLTLDGELLGDFGEASVNVLRCKLSVRPAAVTFRKTILAAELVSAGLAPVVHLPAEDVTQNGVMFGCAVWGDAGEDAFACGWVAVTSVMMSRRAVPAHS